MHELDYMADGRARMFYNEQGGTPWHRLGQSATSALTAKEAITLAGLDFEVELRPMYRYTDLGELEKVEDAFVTVRDEDDKVLGVVGGGYTVIQNRDLFGFCDVLLDQSDIRFETAGALKGGSVCWVLAQVARELVVDGDVHIPYLLMSSSHDGSMAATATLTPTQVVCWNTMTIALSTQRTFSVRHTTNAQSRIAEAKEALGISYRYLDKFEEEVKKLMDQALNDAQFEAIVDELMPDHDHQATEARRDANRNRMRKLWYDAADTAARYRGTGWGAMSAVSEWEQWQKPIGRKSQRDDVLASRILGNRHMTETDKVHKLLVSIR